MVLNHPSECGLCFDYGRGEGAVIQSQEDTLSSFLLISRVTDNTGNTPSQRIAATVDVAFFSILPFLHLILSLNHALLTFKKTLFLLDLLCL